MIDQSPKFLCHEGSDDVSMSILGKCLLISIAIFPGANVIDMLYVACHVLKVSNLL